MLSISKITNCEYYLELGAEDYYTKGGEPPGMWIGNARSMCGVRGKVAADDLKCLFDGYKPLPSGDRGEALVQNALGKSTKSKRERQAAWDCTFSAPKSLSLLWAVADPSVRQRIQAIQQQAVERVFKFMEDELAWTRRGKGGSRREQVSLLGATFEHGTSRELDPQLHTHLLVLNIGVREDRSTGSIMSQPFYTWRDTLGALYRTELSALLEDQLGVLSVRDRDFFSIQGIRGEVSGEFSKRRKQILASMDKLGVKGGEAAATAAETTRRVKSDVPPREELFQLWKARSREFGLGKRKVKMLLGRHVNTYPEKQKEVAVSDAVKRLQEKFSCFSERQLIQQVAIEAQTRGLSATQAIAAARGHIASNELIKLNRTNRHEKLYTTLGALQLEQDLVDQAHKMFLQKGKRVKRKLRQKIAEKYPHLSSSQMSAVNYLLGGATNLCMFAGIAGAGKTTALKGAIEAWKASGYTVVGAAPSGKAARVLGRKTDITSHTVHRLIGDLGISNTSRAIHVARQFGRAAKGKSTWSLPGEIKIDKNTVLVVDEAGMIGTEHMAKLIDYARRYGAMLVLLGDDAQLQAVDPGGPFHSLLQRLPAVEINDIRRQEHAWEAMMVKLVKEGDIKSAFTLLLNNQQLKLALDDEHRFSQTVRGWSKLGIKSPDKSIILAQTNKQVEHLNDLCQIKRRQAGLVTGPKVTIFDDRDEATYQSSVAVGDYVIFTKNTTSLDISCPKKLLHGPNDWLDASVNGIISKLDLPAKAQRRSVQNGTTGTVINAAFGALKIRLETGEVVRLRPASYRHLRRAYAQTIHRAQGSTYDEAHAVLGGNREHTYVQASRAAKRTLLYAVAGSVDQLFSDDTTSSVNVAKRSAIKGLAIDSHDARLSPNGIVNLNSESQDTIPSDLQLKADEVFEDFEKQIVSYGLAPRGNAIDECSEILKRHADFSTEPNQAVINTRDQESGKLGKTTGQRSGIDVTRTKAGAWLAREVKATQKKTPCTRSKLELRLKWDIAALCFAYHAKGKVATQSSIPCSESTFQRVHLPILLANSQVTCIDNVPRTILVALYESARRRGISHDDAIFSVAERLSYPSAFPDAALSFSESSNISIAKTNTDNNVPSDERQPNKHNSPRPHLTSLPNPKGGWKLLIRKGISALYQAIVSLLCGALAFVTIGGFYSALFYGVYCILFWLMDPDLGPALHGIGIFASALCAILNAVWSFLASIDPVGWILMAGTLLTVFFDDDSIGATIGGVLLLCGLACASVIGANHLFHLLVAGLPLVCNFLLSGVGPVGWIFIAVVFIVFMALAAGPVNDGSGGTGGSFAARHHSSSARPMHSASATRTTVSPSIYSNVSTAPSSLATMNQQWAAQQQASEAARASQQQQLQQRMNNEYYAAQNQTTTVKPYNSY